MIVKSLFYRLLRIHTTYNIFGKMHFWFSKNFFYPQKVSGDISNKNITLIIITIAYNNVNLIEKQIELIGKNVTGLNYKHFIVDNSPNKNIRIRIKDICKSQNVGYEEVPYSLSLKFCKWIGLHSMSHGIALNWAYYNIVFPRNPKFFMLLDHDVLPIKKYCFSGELSNPNFYGVYRDRGGGWYLWPGWCVFRNSAISSIKPNFLPYFKKNVFFDTGGNNHKKIYRFYNCQEIYFPKVVTIRIKESKDLASDDAIYHSDYIQIIDECWIHLINGSNYFQISGKEDTINNILNNINLDDRLLFKESCQKS